MCVSLCANIAIHVYIFAAHGRTRLVVFARLESKARRSPLVYRNDTLWHHVATFSSAFDCRVHAWVRRKYRSKSVFDGATANPRVFSFSFSFALFSLFILPRFRVSASFSIFRHTSPWSIKVSIEVPFLAPEFARYALEYRFSTSTSRAAIRLRRIGRTYIGAGAGRCERIPWATPETFGFPWLAVARSCGTFAGSTASGDIRRIS